MTGFRFSVVLCLLFAIILPGCAARMRGPAISQSDQAAIRQASASFVTHAEAGDWDAIIGLYTNDCVMLPPNHEAVVGPAAIREFFSASTVTEFELPPLEIEGRGDLAYARGTYVWTIRIGDGPSVTDEGKWLTVWRKQPDGRWLLSQDMWNSDRAP